VGRDEEIEGIVARLEPHEVRLVTLTGPGGIGKTRLATAAAERAAAAYPDGVYFVPLAEARMAEHVVSATAESLGVRAEGARPLQDTLEERLAADRVLLVLDNFEQVLEAAGVVSDLLASCPGTDVVVTSRAPLRVEGEWEYPVRPLSASAALRLFVERAAASRPDWSLSAAEREPVEEICGGSTASRWRSSWPLRDCGSSSPPSSWSGSRVAWTSWVGASRASPIGREP
jgi:predicted ATPase